MIRKSSGGYTVYARSGRKMGTYRTKSEADARKAQLEMFKAMRAPAFSPGYRGGRIQRSPRFAPGTRFVVSDGSGMDSRRPGVVLDKRTHYNALDGYSRRQVDRGWLIVQITEPYKYISVLPANRLLVGAHSWVGQPRRHARAAKLGHRRAQRSPVRGFAIKNALAYVHFHEKKQGRAQAARDAIQGQGLSYDEAQILLNALHVSRNEIERVNVSRRAQRSPTTEVRGKRVQLHPGTDQWMMGDRYGTVTRANKDGTFQVKMDRSGRSIRVRRDHIGEWF